jgi:hypothetical protein
MYIKTKQIASETHFSPKITQNQIKKDWTKMTISRPESGGDELE